MAYSKKLQQRNKALHIADVSGSLHRKILEIIMENGFLIKQENWNTSQMEMRAVYDSYRVLNLVEEHLSNDR